MLIDAYSKIRTRRRVAILKEMGCLVAGYSDVGMLRNSDRAPTAHCEPSDMQDMSIRYSTSRY